MRSKEVQIGDDVRLMGTGSVYRVAAAWDLWRGRNRSRLLAIEARGRRLLVAQSAIAKVEKKKGGSIEPRTVA